MGRSTHSDLCQNVARLDLHFPRESLESLGWIQCWEGATCGKKKYLYSDTFIKIIDNILYGFHLINEHDYADGGGEEYACCSMSNEDFKELITDPHDDEDYDFCFGINFDNVIFAGGKESIEFLLKELSIETEIENIGSIKQTL